MPIIQPLPCNTALLEAWCHRWSVNRLELFGSARLGFDAARDVDLLVTFSPDAEWSLFDHAQMEQELAEILERRVDLVSRWAIEESKNVLRRNSILDGTTDIYVG